MRRQGYAFAFVHEVKPTHMESFVRSEILIPLACVVLGVLLGVFLDKVVLRRLHAVAVNTLWRADNVLVAAFRGMPILWGLIFGLYLALRTTIADPELENTLQAILTVTLIWSLTIVAARTGSGLIASYSSRDQSFLPPTSLIPNLARILIYIVGLLIVLGRLEVEITPILTALGVGGLAVALALQDTLANIFAGLYLLAARQVNPGDFVRIESGEEGYVVDVNWRSTAVRTFQDNLVIVPNSTVASSTVTNFSLPRRDSFVRIPVIVDYKSDLDHVEHVAMEVAREAARSALGAMPEADPRIYLQSFGEFGLHLNVSIWIRDYTDRHRVRHLFIKNLLVRFREEGIKIPLPIREFEMGIEPEWPNGENQKRIAPPDPFKPAAE